MASEVAQAPAAPNQQSDDTMGSIAESTPYEEPQVNGRVESEEAAANASGFSGNAALPATDLDMRAKLQPASSTSDVNPAGPTPVDEVAPGIQPIADFVPKDASTLSHPTPPPDEPLTTGIADVDTEMANTESDAPVQVSSEAAAPTQPDQSLVRPREDDGEDEPAFKRTRIDDAAPASEEAAPAVADAPETVVASIGAPVPESPTAGTEKADAMVLEGGEASAEEAREESMEGVVAESETSFPVVPSDPVPADIKAEAPQLETQPSATDEPTPVKAEQAVATPVTQSDAQVPSAATQAQSDTAAAAPPAPVPDNTGGVQASTAPITSFQKSSMLDKMKNLKKTKHSIPFLKPVDYVALNIPSYPEIIKQPMDLDTMERKLKNDEYPSVQAYVDDFELIIANVRRFNGDQHSITQAGMNMKAYFDRTIQAIPSADQPMPQQKSKKRSPSISQETKRREPRAAAAAAPAPAPAPAPAAQAPSPLQQEAFALQSDGTPQIRRASSNVRPARAIKPPQNRELTYAKPRRKEHLLELKFCEYVLEEIRGPQFGNMNHVFQRPVDPVALNIPNYRQIVKNPMDLSTMAQKLKTGQYGAASEFKKDFELMIKNCLAFNPVGNAVRDLGIGLQREFENLWSEKNKWEKRNAPESARASSASADGDSDEEEEEEDGGDNSNDTVAALKKQIAAMQSTLETLSGGGASAGKSGAKGPKTQKKTGNKKAGSVSAAAGPKAAPAKAAKPKRERLITYEEKDEISKAVERMDEKQISKLTEIITRECPKYRDMEEMELEIDDLPNNVQLMLLKYVRELFGNPNRKKSAARDYSPDDVAAQDDDDFEPKSRVGPGAGGRAGKRKKHAPMSKAQQEEQLRALQGKLQEFSNAATSGSESPAASNYNTQNAQAESSGDEESEESEEE